MELKKEFKNISLICVSPFKNQINDKRTKLWQR